MIHLFNSLLKKHTLMKKTLLLLVTLFIFAEITLCQEKIEIEGALIIKDSEDANPKAGTIRYNATTNDFEGWNGVFWASLTGFTLGTVTDIDGNTYQTVKIGDQEWMTQNLRTTKYNDGSIIPNITNNTDWANLSTGAYSWYNNDNVYEQPYGKLYNWFAVDDSRGLCPTGWHVPTDAEWTILTDYLGGSSIAGGYLKEAGTTHWSVPNTGATNKSGFTGLPGGERWTSGVFQAFGFYGAWWSSTETGPNSGDAWTRFLNYDDTAIDASDGEDNKTAGCSVRCIQN